jgi:hypothetical protein
LIGLTSLIVKDAPVLPKLDRKRGLFVISKIDEIIAWESSVDRQREAKFVDLGRYLCEVRAGQYWRLEKLHSFDDFLHRRFPDSRRKAYYLMSIHEHLPKHIKKDLNKIGWSKAAELVKVARSDRQKFDCATWLHNAQTMAKEKFRHEVEKHLTGEDTEPSDIVYFKLYKSQIPVVEGAIETAALMLGSDKSRGYCLEMICADFLAGAQASRGDPDVLLDALARSYQLMPEEQKIRFLAKLREENAPALAS